MAKGRKTVLTGSLLSIILLSLCITGVCAYFIAIQARENIFSVGNSDINITEEFRNPDIEPDEITTITKKVIVGNSGKNYSGIRVRVEFSSSDVTNWATIDYNTADWTKKGEYWYYNLPLSPGAETKPLMNEVVCNRPTADQLKDFDIYIYAESRNCENDTTNISELFK